MSIAPVAFRRRFALLETLKFQPANLDAHYFVLKDVGDKDLVAAIERAVRECDEFPSPKMLKAFVADGRARERDHVEAARQEPRREQAVTPRAFELPNGVVVKTTREWRYYCNDCHDSGRRSMWCGPAPSPRPWVPLRRCDRHWDHDPHEYEVFCRCADKNPDVPAWVKARVLGGTDAAT